MLFSPISLRLFFQQCHGLLQPSTLLQFFIFMLCCPPYPVDCPGSLQKHFLYILGQTYLTSILTSPSNVKVCQCGHFTPRSRVSHITAPAGHFFLATFLHCNQVESSVASARSTPENLFIPLQKAPLCAASTQSLPPLPSAIFFLHYTQ